ncbi:hypothetical protein C4564_00710 [Candidatus Microgenomates bacterium]|nr:MAG: hypothetical protein C4564_00710 [Candidatus Microgenomates bacterium]
MKKINSYFFSILAALVFSFLGIVFFPSELYTQDMTIHTPYIKKLINPALYQSDYMVNAWHTQKIYNLYYPTVALITQISPFGYDATLRSVYFVYLLLLFFLYLKVSFLLTKNKYVGLLFLTLLMFRFHVGGTATQLIESEFLPRSLSTVLTLSAIWSIFQGKRLWAFLLFILSFAFHPSAPFAVSLFIAGDFIWQLFKKHQHRLSLKIILLIIGILFFGITALWYLPQSNLVMNQEWLAIMKARNRFMYLDMWNIKNWFAFIVLLTPGIIGLFSPAIRKNHLLHYLLQLTIVVSLLVTLIHILFAVAIPAYPVVLAQLMRIWWYPGLLSLLTFAVLANYYLRSKRLKILFLGFLLVSGLGYQHYQKQLFQIDPNWLEVQAWAKEYTDINCVFLVSFDSNGFRVGSQRSIVGDRKDGTLGAYSLIYAKAWQEKKNRLVNWQNYSALEIVDLNREFQFDYLITPVGKTLPFRQVYTNNKYQVFLAPENKCQKRS